ncbi:MAG: ATP-binding protein [Thermodesulfovibrio sp.]|uniref:sensor histidine kinase n=1 Tax=unclassified Thermodesulfovibrio TaxID=2645936 RepID=UPI00083B1CDA|nr:MULTISPECIES: ATP-binding protein [unclassified Thermodesulfovibrio]MDI1472711.1 ATP-binding protein [Thermodesulfovibrio sp. 1176]MDI6713409.1 ATP-binding protein [Thermodesulfovibrio sp.]
MNRILLLLNNKENEKLLKEELSGNYEILIGNSSKDIEQFFDMAIIDGINLEKMQKDIILRRYEEKPLFLPFLMITSNKDIGLATKHLWKVIDEVITIPIIKVELQARIAVLLRARYYSLQMKNRLEEIKIFAHALGHELQSPIRAIKHFSEFIQSDCSEAIKDKCKNYCQHIIKLSERVHEINESLYNFLTIGKAGINIDKIQLSKIIEGLKKDLGQEIEEKNASVELEKEFEFYADKNLIEVILRNLILNAILYSKKDIPPKIKISVEKKNKEIIIEVKDNGIGIPEKELDNIFQMFYRLHSVKNHRGSGLGLCIVKKCVELMNGRVWVESKIGEGSRFFINLPFKPTIYR